MECKETECTRPGKHARGYCGTHYARHQRAGEFGGPPCLENGCSRTATSKELCPAHYKKLMYIPSPRSSEPNPWYLNQKGYIVRHALVNGKRTQQIQHREVMENYLMRRLVPGEEVHHLNGDRADNRIENLELWSTKQPKGQRIPDKVQYAKEILALYEPNALVN